MLEKIRKSNERRRKLKGKESHKSIFNSFDISVVECVVIGSCILLIGTTLIMFTI